jgi:hypothetical protein
MTDYLRTFEGMPAGLKVDVSHPDYRKLETMAREEGLSQKAFSRILALEASRVAAAKPAGGTNVPPAAAPAPAKPAKPAVPENFDKLSMRQQFAASLAVRSNRGPHG